jgi:hypothetical protein
MILIPQRLILCYPRKPGEQRLGHIPASRQIGSYAYNYPNLGHRFEYLDQVWSALWERRSPARTPNENSF